MEIKDIISDIAKELSAVDEVLAVFLYGSAARGDYSERHSDIDVMIFLNTKNVPKRIENSIRTKFLGIGTKYKVKIHPEFQGSIIRESDKTLMQKVLEEGEVIYSKGMMTIFGKRIGLEPFYLYTFSTKDKNKRPLLSKTLHGGSSWYYKDNKKIEKKYPGIINNTDITEFGKGSLLVKRSRQKDIESVFKIHGADYKIRKILYG